MVTVRFYGDLKQFGSSFKMDVASVPEALRALMTQITGLREHIEKGHYKVTADGKQLTADSLETGLEKTLHLTPVTKGAGKNMGIGQIIVGVILIAASWYAGGAAGWGYLGTQAGATMAFTMGASMIMGGIAQLLTKIPSLDMGVNGSDDLKSSSFSNLSNMAAQGAPVPIIYGQMMVGSKVLSQGVRSVYQGSAGSGESSDDLYVNSDPVRKTVRPVKDSSSSMKFDETNMNVKNKNYVISYQPTTSRGGN